jgi:hypothetical protein
MTRSIARRESAAHLFPIAPVQSTAPNMLSVAARRIMSNLDGSSCFMDSLLVALFFPSRLQMLDPYILRGERSDTDDPERARALEVLRFVAGVVRGATVADMPSMSVVRPALSASLSKFFATNFSRGQQDPVDLMEAIFSTFEIGGVFKTVRRVVKLYSNGSRTDESTSDMMFRMSLLDSINGGLNDIAAFFPITDTMHVDPTACLEDVKVSLVGATGRTAGRAAPCPRSSPSTLLTKHSSVYFAGGPMLCFTRELVSSDFPAISYGTYDASSGAYTLSFTNISTGLLQVYELQSVVCWAGTVSSSRGTSGHYVSYVYDEPRHTSAILSNRAADTADSLRAGTWYFYDDMRCTRDPRCGQLDAVPSGETIETFPVCNGRVQYAPSTNGTLFIYAQLT